MKHRNVVAGLYFAFAVFLFAEIAVSWNDAADALGDYLGTGIAGHAAVALAYSTPISCLVLAFFVHRGSRHPLLAVPAAHAVFFFEFAVIPAIYLLWVIVREVRSAPGR
ncbi:MAG: hypothetical protein R3315_11305 [Woeseiaceae bacterium]|nr:hypothetical protein [Woeseiaceae bacterium]